MPTVNIKAHRPTLVQSGLRCHYDEQLNPAGVNADTTGEEVHGKDSLLFFQKKKKKKNPKEKKREAHCFFFFFFKSGSEWDGRPANLGEQAGRQAGGQEPLTGCGSHRRCKNTSLVNYTSARLEAAWQASRTASRPRVVHCP